MQHIRAPKEWVSTVGQAVTAPSVRVIEIPFYPGNDARNTAISADGVLKLAPGVKVVKAGAPNAYAPVENTGSGSTEVGAAAKVGTILSAGNVSLLSKAMVYGDIRTSGKLELQDGADATGVKEEHANLGELRAYRMEIKVPALSESVNLEPNQDGALTAGTGYASVVLKRDSKVSVAAGTYYVNLLRIDAEAKLQVDTTAGPVIIWVLDELDYKGSVTVTGTDGAVLFGYLGSRSTSLEKPLNASVIAPNATLRLAPIGSPGWRGSFFAKSIEAAEANSTITHRPFDYWDQLLDIKPILHCVRRFGSNSAAALFGYENHSDVDATIPIGPVNGLSPMTSAQPPTVFQPGLHARQFWAPFELPAGVAWTLANTTVALNSDVPDCKLGEAPADDLVPIDPEWRPIDVPGPLPAYLDAIRVPDQHTPAVSNISEPPALTRYVNPILLETSASSSSGDVATAKQPQIGSADELADYTFTSNYHQNQDEGICGSIDPYAILWVNEQYFGNAWGATVQIPKDQEKVHVRVEVWDDDGGLCGGDDLVEVFDAQLDTYSDVVDSSPGFFGFHWNATPTRQPKLCMDWNAQFLDGGQWDGPSGRIGAEDFAATKNLQKLPASFGHAGLKIEKNAALLYDWEGYLDRDGCIPTDMMPPRAAWMRNTGLALKTTLYSEMCLDSSGNNCGDRSGIGVVVRHPDVAGNGVLTKLCQVFAEDPDSVSEPNCSIGSVDWSVVPPLPFKVDFRTPPANGEPPLSGIPINSSMRAAAVASHILRREIESNGELGLEQAMVKHRFGVKGPFVINVDTYCPSGETSCSGGARLYLEPAGVRKTDLTYLKFAVAHEFGHWVSAAGMGDMPSDYGSGPGIDGVSPLCQCGHVPADQQPHCLQSLELPSGAQQEGFADLFSAKVWNEAVENSCTFAHAKDFLSDECMPGVKECVTRQEDGLILNKYPVPFSCRDAIRWRNNRCLGADASEDMLAHGVEMDWLEFYYAINNNAVEQERLSMNDLFAVYAKTCGRTDESTGAPIGCKQDRVSWSGLSKDPNSDPPVLEHKSLVDGVKATLGGDSFKARAFVREGRAYGVSNER